MPPNESSVTIAQICRVAGNRSSRARMLAAVCGWSSSLAVLVVDIIQASRRFGVQRSRNGRPRQFAGNGSFDALNGVAALQADHDACGQVEPMRPPWSSGAYA